MTTRPHQTRADNPNRYRKLPPLVPGARCRYRGQYVRSEEVLTLVSARDGVAVVRNAEGREYQEALAVLVSAEVRDNER